MKSRLLEEESVIILTTDWKMRSRSTFEFLLKSLSAELQILRHQINIFDSPTKKKKNSFFRFSFFHLFWYDTDSYKNTGGTWSSLVKGAQNTHFVS